MSEEEAAKPWYQTMPGVMTAIAALLTAITGLVAALAGLLPRFLAPAVVSKTSSHDCISGYVWRLANREDHVCVDMDTHLRTLQDNELAGSRRNPAGGAWGPDTCLSGFVFRVAFPGDLVCVTPGTRDQAAADNAQAAVRIRR